MQKLDALKRAWWLAARDRVKEAVEGPDSEIDYIIRSVLENDFRVTAELRMRHAVLDDPMVAAGVELAVRNQSTERLRRAW